MAPSPDESPAGDVELLGPGHGGPVGEDLAAARVDHGRAAGERVRASRRRLPGSPSASARPRRRREADPDRREAARARPDTSAVQVGSPDPGRADELVRRGENGPRLGQALADAPRRRARARTSWWSWRCQRRRSSSLSIVMLRWVGSTCASVTVARAPRKPVARVLGPLDEHNRAIEVGLEIAPALGGQSREAVEVEMSDRNAALRSGGRS